MNQAVAIYNKRLNSLGTTEPSIQKDGTDRITIQLPGEKNPDRVAALVGSTGTLYFLPLQERADAGCVALRGRGSGHPAEGLALEPAEPAEGQDRRARPRTTRSTTTSAPATARPRRRRSSCSSSCRSRSCRRAGRSWRCRRTRSPSTASRPTNRSCPVGLTTQGKTYWYMFDLPAKDKLLTGKDLSTARADFDPPTGEPVVSMQFNDRGGKLFKEITGNLAQPGQGRLRRREGHRPERRPAQLRAAVHRHPRRRARDVPVHRLPAHARRHRQGLPDHGRHARRGQGRRHGARVRLAAGRVRAPVADAGVGHARQDVARAGPLRGYRGPAHRDDLDDHLLPVPRCHRRPRAAHLRGAVLRGDPRDTGDADAARHRRPDPHDRRRGRRERRRVRTDQGGGARRAEACARPSPRATRRASRRSSTPTR